ncbi:pectate lyase, partial [Bacillus spizizenii]|nr:pectate lyase [Bacillus spizizenii]
MKRFCLWFAVFSLLLVLLPGKAFGAVDFPNTSTNGLLGFAGNAKNEKGISKAST